MSLAPAPSSGPTTSPAPLARLYAPLASAALLSALAGPVLNHSLARSPHPAPALAGFWVGYSVLVALEAACFVWQPTALAFLGRERSRRRLATLAIAAGALTSAAALLAGGPCAGFLFRVVVPTGPEAAATAAQVMRSLAALPLLVALRAVLAADALRGGRGAAIPAALAFRLALLAAWPALAPASGRAPDVCGALIVAGLGELLVLAAARGGVRPSLALAPPPALSRMLAVAAPLALSTLVWAALRPALHAVLGRLAAPELAQARFGLVFAVFMTLCAPVWALRDLAVLAEREHTCAAVMRRFAVRVAAFVSVVYGATLALSAFAGGMRSALGFTPATGPFPWAGLVLLALAPVLVAARMPAQGTLIARHRTRAFALVPGARLLLTAAAGLLLARFWPLADGALAGAALLVAGETFEAWGYARAARGAALVPAATEPETDAEAVDSLARAA